MLSEELERLARKAEHEMETGLDPRPEIETAAFKGECWRNRDTIIAALKAQENPHAD